MTTSSEFERIKDMRPAVLFLDDGRRAELDGGAYSIGELKAVLDLAVECGAWIGARSTRSG